MLNDEIAAYISEAPSERHAVLSSLREACLSALENFDESMAYGMPSYSRNGEVEVAFASQKQNIALYILRTDVFAAHMKQLSGLRLGKGVIRYPRPDQIDMHVVQSMLRATAASDGPVC